MKMLLFDSTDVLATDVNLWSMALFWEPRVFQFQCFQRLLPRLSSSQLKIRQNIFSALCAVSIFQALD